MEHPETRKILFVCMGNICRSPAAEAVFHHLVAEAGRASEFTIDSAGTTGYHTGEPADRRMRAAAAQRGYPLESRARRIAAEDFHRFDWIVAMDEANFADVCAVDPGGTAHVVRMCDYCEIHTVNEVPDPYYGGEAGFHQVLDILEDACSNLLKSLP